LVFEGVFDGTERPGLAFTILNLAKQMQLVSAVEVVPMSYVSVYEPPPHRLRGLEPEGRPLMMIPPHYRNVLEVDLSRMQAKSDDSRYGKSPPQTSPVLATFKLEAGRSEVQFGPDAALHLPPESAESFFLAFGHSAELKSHGALSFFLVNISFTSGAGPSECVSLGYLFEALASPGLSRPLDIRMHSTVLQEPIHQFYTKPSFTMDGERARERQIRVDAARELLPHIRTELFTDAFLSDFASRIVGYLKEFKSEELSEVLETYLEASSTNTRLCQPSTLWVDSVMKVIESIPATNGTVSALIVTSSASFPAHPS
jgi:hypothetical protein